MWKKADIPTSAQRLQQEGYSRLTALVIANAGVENKEQAEEFLHSETVHTLKKCRRLSGITYTEKRKYAYSVITIVTVLRVLQFCT